MDKQAIVDQIQANVLEMERLWRENEALATPEFREDVDPRELGKAEAASQALEQSLRHYHRALFDAAKTSGDIVVMNGDGK